MGGRAWENLRKRRRVSAGLAEEAGFSAGSARSGGSGEPPHAEQILAHAVQVAPNDAESWFRYGVLTSSAERIQKAIALDPWLPDQSRRLAEVTHSEPALKDALRTDPFDDAAWDLGGRIMAEKGNFADAFFDFERAIKLHPSGQYLYDYALALVRADRFDDAQSEAEMAVRADSSSGRRRMSCSAVFTRGKRNWPEAAREYSAALALRPDLARVQLRLGTVLAAEGRSRWRGGPFSRGGEGQRCRGGAAGGASAAGHGNPIAMRLFLLGGSSVAVGMPQYARRSGFIDIAAQSGLTVANTFGGKEKKDSILESTGTGAAIFDFDGDGANDIFIANGPPSRSELYKNDGAGHFTEVGQQAGLTRTGWAQAACVGDIDNDGHPDLFVTYYGHNSALSQSRERQISRTSPRAPDCRSTGTRWGSGCALIDYDRDGRLDIFVANYVDLDLANVPKPGSSKSCEWKGMAVWCGPHGLPPAHNALYHNNGDGTFTDVSDKAGILAPGRALRAGRGDRGLR